MRKSIDWNSVKKRLDDSLRASSSALKDDGARLEAVLKQRAIHLAERKNNAVVQKNALSLLSFLLGAERYAMDLAELAEILPLAQLTAVPGAPAELSGVINVRGEIVPVIDLARILELPASAEGAHGYVLLLRDPERELGLKVDQLGSVSSLSESDVAAMRAQPAAGASRNIAGILRDNTLVLNMEAVFTHAIFNVH